MNSTYLFAIILAGGYIGSRVIFTRFKLTGETLHLFLLGGEYILIGYLLGPSVFNILNREIIHEFSPVIVVGIGWLGLLLGNQLSIRNLRRFPLSLYQLLTVQNLFFLIISAFFIWGAAKFFPGELKNMGFANLGILIAAMMATSPTVLSLMAHILHIPNRFTFILRFLSSVEGFIGILLLGFIYSMIHEPLLLFNFYLTGIHWFVITLLLAGLGGLFFHLIMRETNSDFETVLIIMGIVIFTGGMSYYLNLSALFVSFVIGFVMANLSNMQVRVNQILASTEKQFYIVFLIFAGALWNFQNWQLLFIAPLFVLFRIAAKFLSTYCATRIIEGYKKEHPAAGLGLSSVAGLALAITLEFYLMRPGQFSGWLLNLMILMVLLNQVAAPVLLRQLLPRLRLK